MPFTARDATRHTKKAAGKPKSKRACAKAANSSLKKDGDEGKAVRIGNFAAKKAAKKRGGARK